MSSGAVLVRQAFAPDDADAAFQCVVARAKDILDCKGISNCSADMREMFRASFLALAGMVLVTFLLFSPAANLNL